jgi:two-component system chemotaxis response regulator CheB
MPPSADPPRVDVVAVVGSAGAVGAMEALLGALPADLPAAVLVVLHLMAQRSSVLPQILARSASLRVKQGEHGDVLERGMVYVAPPGSHMLAGGDGTLRIDHSELVHHVRPSADVLLLSLAQEWGGRTVAVILSGTGIDGAAGAAAVRLSGGTVLAQDEETAQYFGMPGAAILAGGVDRVLALSDIAPAVIEWVAAPA